MNYNLDKRIEREIISFAKSFSVKKLILFGSRARGTNRERSDIDLAAQGGDIFSFAEAIDEKINTLLSFDVVNLDDNLDDDFKAEIARDGIILYKEVTPIMKKYESFCKSLNNLVESAKIEPPYSVLELTGLVALFEICFEQSWKALREILLIHGVNKAATGSPREIIKAGYEFHFISDEIIWLDMLKRRNQTIYDEKVAIELANLIFDKYLSAFVNLRDELDKRTKNLSEGDNIAKKNLDWRSNFGRNRGRAYWLRHLHSRRRSFKRTRAATPPISANGRSRAE